MLVFEQRRNWRTRRKPLGEERRTNKLNPHMTLDLGLEPGPHRWEAIHLTTAPSLHSFGAHIFAMLNTDTCQLFIPLLDFPLMLVSHLGYFTCGEFLMNMSFFLSFRALPFPLNSSSLH